MVEESAPALSSVIGRWCFATRNCRPIGAGEGRPWSFLIHLIADAFPLYRRNTNQHVYLLCHTLIPSILRLSEFPPPPKANQRAGGQVANGDGRSPEPAGRTQAGHKDGPDVTYGARSVNQSRGGGGAWTSGPRMPAPNTPPARQPRTPALAIESLYAHLPM